MCQALSIVCTSPWAGPISQLRSGNRTGRWRPLRSHLSTQPVFVPGGEWHRHSKWQRLCSHGDMEKEAQEVRILSEGTFQCEVSEGMWKMEVLIGSLGMGMAVRECVLEEGEYLFAEVRETVRS